MHFLSEDLERYAEQHSQQEAAALYERQEREEIARLEQMQHDAPVMRMTRG